MSTNLDMLLTPAQLAEARRHDQPPRSTRELTLMADFAAMRVRCEAAEQRADDLARKVAYLSADLRAIKGDNEMPLRGCKIAHIRIGEATVLVEYAYDPGEPQTYTDPGCGPTVEAYRAFIGGYWLDLEDIRESLSTDVLEGYIIGQEEA